MRHRSTNRLTPTIRIPCAILLSLGALLLLLIPGFILYEASAGVLVRISLSIFLGAVGVLLFWSAYQLFKVSFGPAHNATVPFSDDPLSIFPDDDCHSIRDTTAQLLEANPNDQSLLWMHANALLQLNEPAPAEAAYDRLLVQLAAADPSLLDENKTYLSVATQRFLAIMLQNDGRFEAECTAFLRKIISHQDKVTLLDQLACLPLFEERPQLYRSAEFCIRKALEIDPENLTLKGTLGALLAERGNFAEAEPLLRACYQSTSKHDRGITSYYLALLAENSGDPNTARKLAKDSITLHPEPWLVKKANTLTERIGRGNLSGIPRT